jgi:toxin secretion/phage lysis holin
VGIILIDILHFGFSFLSDYMEYLLGGCDCLLLTLIISIILEYISGLLFSIINKKVSDELGLKFIFKTVLIFIFIAIAQMIDSFLLIKYSQFRIAIILFYIVCESMYIFENIISSFTCLSKSNR